MALQGSCLCGGVRFEVSEPFAYVTHCHCEFCKRIAGGYGTVSGRAPTEAIRVVEGEELLRSYTPDGGSAKTFCSTCGSNLFGGGWPESETSSVRLCVVRPRLRPQARGAHVRPLGRRLGDPPGRRPAAVRDPRHLSRDPADRPDDRVRGHRRRDRLARRARSASPSTESATSWRTGRSAMPSSSSAARSSCSRPRIGSTRARGRHRERLRGSRSVARQPVGHRRGSRGGGRRRRSPRASRRGRCDRSCARRRSRASGHRIYTAEDLEGHRWMFAQRL